MIDDDFAPGFRASLHQKDAGIILETARELGISLPESERVAALVCELVARGQGDLDSSAIAKLIWEQN
jgi:2-hydroxy-3-oxopropionate reductase